MITTIYDTDIPDEHLTIMGKIFLNWSLLEFILTRIVSSLLSIDYKTGRIITRSMNSATKIDKIRSLVKHKNIGSLNRLEEVITKLNSAREKRNDIAHGVWTQDDNNNYYIIKYSSRNQQNPIKKKMSIDELNLIYTEVTSALAELKVWEDNLSASKI